MRDPILYLDSSQEERRPSRLLTEVQEILCNLLHYTPQQLQRLREEEVIQQFT